MPGPLLILGASVRASAFSAIRAGFSPVAIDLFADLDLASCGPVRRVEPSGYPDDLPRLAAEAPASPWMYTGALENHPGVIDRIAADRPLWGNDRATLQGVRDPITLAEALRLAGLPALDVRPDPTGLPRDGSWLIKPIRSAGGIGIRPLLESEPGADPKGTVYFQRIARGPSGSAVFIGDRGSARLVGVTRQWVGHGSSPFGYLGSVGPVRVPGSAREQLKRTGIVLARSFGLRGLFGVDFVLAGGTAWPTEVNPRLSASVEVLEYATGRSLLMEHARAFGAEVQSEGHADCSPPGSRCVGKLVVYAPADGIVPPSIRWRTSDPGSYEPPRLADLPAPGTSFRRGQPVLTLLQPGPTAGACRRRLARRLVGWQSRLARWSVGEDPGPRT